MELLKPVRKIGNSGGVHLPAAWIGGEVEVKLIKEPIDVDRIASSIIIRLLKMGLSKNLIGFYITGSAARDELSEGSDIDFMIILDNKSKIKALMSDIKNIDNKYDAVILTDEELQQSLKTNPAMYSNMLLEAKPVINESFLEKVKKEINMAGFLRFIKDAKRVIKINKTLLDLYRESETEESGGAIVYSYMLRLRELYFITHFLKKGNFVRRRKDFEDYTIKKAKITRDEFDNLYRSYQNVRGDLPKKKVFVKIDLLEKILEHFEKEVKIVEKLIKEKIK